MHVRPTDRIQAATTWLLVALGTIAVALSLMTGAAVYRDGMHRAGLEAGERTRVDAVMLEAPPTASSLGHHGRAQR